MHHHQFPLVLKLFQLVTKSTLSYAFVGFVLAQTRTRQLGQQREVNVCRVNGATHNSADTAVWIWQTKHAEIAKMFRTPFVMSPNGREFYFHGKYYAKHANVANFV